MRSVLWRGWRTLGANGEFSRGHGIRIREGLEAIVHGAEEDFWVRLKIRAFARHRIGGERKNERGNEKENGFHEEMELR